MFDDTNANRTEWPLWRWTIAESIVMRHGAIDAAPSVAHLLYDRTDPCAVYIRYSNIASPTGLSLWCFDRELLRIGLTSTCGEGDVRVAPHRKRAVVLAITGVDGGGGRSSAKLWLSTYDQIEAFVGQMLDLVPLGDEVGLSDADLVRLLAA